jgi:DNA-binding CsgD family transcriptional regulator
MEGQYFKLVETLYAGTLDAAAWNEALIQVADWVGGSGVQLLAIDPQVHRTLRDESQRLDPVVLRAYRDYWHAHDVLVAPALRLAEGVPAADHHLVPPSEFAQTAMLNDFMRPADTPHVLVAWLHKAPDKAVALSIKATGRHGPFQDAELQRLGSVIPHFQRALRIRDRLEAHGVMAGTLAACLDRISFGVFLLDQHGTILETNGFAAELLRGKSGLDRDVDKKLALNGAAGDVLRRWIASGLRPATASSDVLHVQRLDRAPLSVVATPLAPTLCGWISSHPRWLVLVFDPERRRVPTLEFLVDDLRLTPKEAEFAALLSMGCNLETAAQRLDIGVHTARSHLKSIFAKTGTHSQTELVRRVLTGLAMQAGAAP